MERRGLLAGVEAGALGGDGLARRVGRGDAAKFELGGVEGDFVGRLEHVDIDQGRGGEAQIGGVGHRRDRIMDRADVARELGGDVGEARGGHALRPRFVRRGGAPAEGCEADGEGDRRSGGVQAHMKLSPGSEGARISGGRWRPVNPRAMGKFQSLGKKRAAICLAIRAGRSVLASRQHQLDLTSASTTSPRLIRVA